MFRIDKANAGGILMSQYSLHRYNSSSIASFDFYPSASNQCKPIYYMRLRLDIKQREIFLSHARIKRIKSFATLLMSFVCIVDSKLSPLTFMRQNEILKFR